MFVTFFFFLIKLIFKKFFNSFIRTKSVIFHLKISYKFNYCLLEQKFKRITDNGVKKNKNDARKTHTLSPTFFVLFSSFLNR